MSDRAVSEIISYVLVFALIVASVAVVTVSGLDTLRGTQNAEQIENAERAFDVLADNVADLHRRGAPNRATEINLGEAELSTGSNTTMTVEVDDSGSYETEVERDIRPIVYSGEEDRDLVYEGGGVFRTSRDGDLQVQDPPFILDGDRVLIPVVGLNSPGGQTFGGSTVLVRTRLRETTIRYNDSQGNVNGIRVTIENSSQESLWSAYFEDNGFTCGSVTDGIECEFDPPGGIDRVYVVDHDILVSIDP